MHQLFTLTKTSNGRIHISVDWDATVIPDEEQITIQLYDNTEPIPTPMKAHTLSAKTTTFKLDWPLNCGDDRFLFQLSGWNGFKTIVPTAVWIIVSVDHAHILNSPPNKPCVYWGDDEYKSRPEVQHRAAIRHEMERITKIQSKAERNLDWSLYDPIRVTQREKDLRLAWSQFKANKQ